MLDISKRHGRAKEILFKFFSDYPIHCILILLLIVLSFLSDVFFTPTNLLNILSAESGRGVLALGVGFVIITSGIDLSVAAIAALSSVVSTSLVQDAAYASRLFPNLGYVPVWAAVLAGLSAGLIIGAFNGLMVAFFKVPPFIATLGGTTISLGVALMYTGAYTVPMLRPDFKRLGQATVGPFPIIVIYFFIIVIISSILLNKTRFGKRLYAIGGNENAAVVSGINIKFNLMMVYIWSGILAAFVGIFLSARSGAGTPKMAQGYELDAIAGAIVGGLSTTGGVGKVGGIAVGVLLLGVLNNGFLIMGVSPYLQQIIKGFIIVGAVAFDTIKEKRLSF